MKKSVKRHSDKFIYNKVIYINAKTKVIITCKIHGDFKQTPDKHLQGIDCCPECNLINKSQRFKIIGSQIKTNNLKSKEEYLSLVKEKYGDLKFDIVGEWEGITKTNVCVFCENHGKTITNCRNLIVNRRVYSCLKCSNGFRAKNKSHLIEQIIDELKLNCGDYKYIFPENYSTKKDKIKIICDKHGEFDRSVHKLLSGQSCSKCKIEQLINDKILVGGYCDTLFKNKPELKNKEALLYYFEINDGKYYKIGITTNSDPLQRIRSLKNRSRGVIKIIKIITTKKLKLYDAFNIEQRILKENSEFCIKRRWSTELFNTNIKDNILQYFT